jgi:hypothetical protein
MEFATENDCPLRSAEISYSLEAQCSIRAELRAPADDVTLFSDAASAREMRKIDVGLKFQFLIDARESAVEYGSSCGASAAESCNMRCS